MNQSGGARRVEKLIHEFGCLPALGDLSTIARFDALEVAAAIETELSKAGEYGFTKITLHMDLPDAAMLAKHLRKRVR